MLNCLEHGGMRLFKHQDKENCWQFGRSVNNFPTPVLFYLIKFFFVIKKQQHTKNRLVVLFCQLYIDK